MFNSLIQLGNQLGVFESLKNKLVARPDEASQAFSEVLEELSKTYKALEDEMTNYLSIWFDQNDQKGIAEQRRMLIGLEGGSVRVNMAKARGHCSKIGSIYDRYMNTWLASLDTEQHFELTEIFHHLSGADSVFLDATDELARWIEHHASQTLDVLGLGDIQGANQQISDARREVVNERRDLATATAKLYRLNADFVKTSKAI